MLCVHFLPLTSIRVMDTESFSFKNVPAKVTTLPDGKQEGNA